MAALLGAYRTSQRPSSASVIDQIIDAPPFSFDASQRTDLIKELLEDVRSPSSSSRITRPDLPRVLLALKTLGKIPTGSDILAKPDCLSTLLSAGLTEGKGKGRSSATEVDAQPENAEALRTIANTMLLHESARSAFILEEVNGPERTLAALERASTPEQVFILSRILFLCTVSRSSLILEIVEQRHPNVVDIIGKKLELCLSGIMLSQPMAKEGMTDLLKFCFNLLHHYPKMMADQEGVPTENSVIGDHWHERLDGILAPLLRVYHALPPTSPSPLTNPLSHVINALITVPVTPQLRPLWFNEVSSLNTTSKSGIGNKKRSGSKTGADSPGIKTTTPSSRSSSAGGSPPRTSTLDKALSVFGAGRKSLSLSRSPSPNPHATVQSIFNSISDLDNVQRTQDLLVQTLSHYFPDAVEPDDLSVRERPQKEGTDMSIDEILCPLVFLLTHFCRADQATRIKVRQWVVPEDTDRTVALEGQATLLGKGLRIMSCVYHPRLKDAIGELFYVCCDSDASILSALMGYGNVAGYLFNQGVLSAPPPPISSLYASSNMSSTPTATSVPDTSKVNPITGIVEEPKGPSAMDEMTEEEKEQEMEKLFVLFDRLERNGGISKENNPMRKVIQKASQGG